MRTIDANQMREQMAHQTCVHDGCGAVAEMWGVSADETLWACKQHGVAVIRAATERAKSVIRKD